MDVLGRAIIKNLNYVRELMPDLVIAEREHKTVWQTIYPFYSSKDEPEEARRLLDGAYEHTFKGTWGEFSSVYYFNQSTDEECKQRWVDRFNEWTIDTAGMLYKCYVRCDGYVVIGPNDTKEVCWLLPEELVDITTYVTYDHLTGAQRRAMLSSDGQDAAPIALVSLDASAADVKDKKSQLESDLSSLAEEAENIKSGKTAELQALQEEVDRKMAELEAQKAKMMEALEAKKAEMQAMMDKLNIDIFKLDTEIYAIRCYTGENVEVNHIIKGKAAPTDQPIIIQQKMRYMDEELGKYASIYGADFNDAKTFIALLQNRPDLVDYLLPTDRCVVTMRVSRSNRGYVSVAQKNILDWYEKYHGKKVALLIRDGENVYLTWTDDDRVMFSEDNFFRPGETELEDGEDLYARQPYESDQEYEHRIKEKQMEEAKIQVGRYFVFSILQGLIDRHLINLPDKVVLASSPYVIFSYADGWITTNKYGDLDDMIDAVNAQVAVGDNILAIDYVYPERRTGWTNSSTYVDQTYHNDRGIGEKNRTHDVVCESNRIYPVNLIVHRARYKYKTKHSYDDKIDEHEQSFTDAEYETHFTPGYSRSWTAFDVEKVEGSDDYEYYISLEKDENWQTGKSARANFRVDTDEFINLTYMNSVWLEYVLTNHKASNIRIHGQYVDFAHMIKFIKTALDHCRKREETVTGWLTALPSGDKILADDEWPVKLSEWMIKNNIHNFSPFRCKQFVRAIEGGNI